MRNVGRRFTSLYGVDVIKAAMINAQGYSEAEDQLMISTGETRAQCSLAIRYAHEALSVPFGANDGPQLSLGTNTNYS